jgi:hypothetical protein
MCVLGLVLAWFVRGQSERLADEWDMRIEEDAANGRLDAAYARLERENKEESERPLDEVVDEGKLP